MTIPSVPPVIQHTTVSTTPAAPTPVTITTRQASAMATGPGVMPALHSHYAPHFSSWPGDSLIEFLHEYDNLACSLGLTDTQKVDVILRYVPASIREFWQTLDSYLVKNWEAFCAALKDLYPDTPAGNHYTSRGLQEFMKISAWTRIQDEDDLALYH